LTRYTGVSFTTVLQGRAGPVNLAHPTPSWHCCLFSARLAGFFLHVNRFQCSAALFVIAYLLGNVAHPGGIDVLTRQRAFTIRGGKRAIDTARTSV